MSCTMIITGANELASRIHDRMPVLLQPNDFDRWLAGNAGTELLKPAPDDYLQTWTVSRRVNSSRRRATIRRSLILLRRDARQAELEKVHGSEGQLNNFNQRRPVWFASVKCIGWRRDSCAFA